MAVALVLRRENEAIKREERKAEFVLPQSILGERELMTKDLNGAPDPSPLEMRCHNKGRGGCAFCRIQNEGSVGWI